MIKIFYIATKCISQKKKTKKTPKNNNQKYKKTVLISEYLIIYFHIWKCFSPVHKSIVKYKGKINMNEMHNLNLKGDVKMLISRKKNKSNTFKTIHSLPTVFTAIFAVPRDVVTVL